MKKILFSLLTTGLLFSSCGKKVSPEVEVQEFAEKVADMVEKKDLNSLKYIYPEIMQADSLVNLGQRVTVITQVSPGVYNASIAKGVSLRISRSEDGDMKVVESRGLFAFPEDDLGNAKSGSLQNVDLTDIQLLQLINGGENQIDGSRIDLPKKAQTATANKKEEAAEPSRPRNYNSSNYTEYLMESPSVSKGGRQVHFFKGYFADANNNKYPVKFAFIEQGGGIGRAEYLNVRYKARLTFDVWLNSGNLELNTSSRSKDYTIDLRPTRGNGSWTGSFYDGSKYLDVFIEPTNDQFSF